jgi:hypothetical protein
MQLNTTQLQTLKTNINAETDASFVAFRQANDETGMANWYNANSSFTTWKTQVTIEATGQAFNGTEWAGMTSANHSRLQTVAQYLSTYNPTQSDVRAMFNDIWSGAGGTTTRANLLLLWKRLAKRGEKIYATGTGTDGVPGQLVLEGDMTAQNISDALRV